ncbi:MAG: hypothetical protein JW928_08730 [Candidatus Aureabacteria bacterium]|nr:hypothetical protein [Candidatus Auribacterota bacterium]
MEQVHWVRVQETLDEAQDKQEEVWGSEEAAAGWAEIVPAQVRVETVSALAVEQKPLINPESPAIRSTVRIAEQRWSEHRPSY